ncbi:unnamed protein product [Arctogadus glacialis]
MASKLIKDGRMIDLRGRGPDSFKMSGHMYHRTPSVLFHDANQKPKYAQIYIYDEERKLDNWQHDTEKKRARVNSIEGQLWVLKNCHMLLHLNETIKMDDVDKIISTQLPDKDPELFRCVTTMMLHVE